MTKKNNHSLLERETERHVICVWDIQYTELSTTTSCPPAGAAVPVIGEMPNSQRWIMSESWNLHKFSVGRLCTSFCPFLSGRSLPLLVYPSKVHRTKSRSDQSFSEGRRKATAFTVSHESPQPTALDCCHAQTLPIFILSFLPAWSF